MNSFSRVDNLPIFAIYSIIKFTIKKRKKLYLHNNVQLKFEDELRLSL